MERISIRNKYKNRKNNIKSDEINNNLTNEDKKIENSNNSKKNIIISKQEEKKNKNEFQPEKNIIQEKKDIKQTSKGVTLLKSSYQKNMEKDLANNINNTKNIKEDKGVQQMMTLLKLMKIIDSMNSIKNDTKATEIIPHLYIGSINCASNLEELKSKNITHILCCGIGLNLFFPDKFKYKRIDLIDNKNSNIRQYFDETNKFINDALVKEGNILVHCQAGISRSASIIIAYLMKHKNMNFNKAFGLIKEKRGQMQPNSGFIRQLKEYEKELGY